MHVDTDRQRLTDRNFNTDIMDTTSDSAHGLVAKGKAPENQVKPEHPVVKDEAVAEDEVAHVVERPREGGNDGVQEPSKHLRKAPH